MATKKEILHRWRVLSNSYKGVTAWRIAATMQSLYEYLTGNKEDINVNSEFEFLDEVLDSANGWGIILFPMVTRLYLGEKHVTRVVSAEEIFEILKNNTIRDILNYLKTIDREHGYLQTVFEDIYKYALDDSIYESFYRLYCKNEVEIKKLYFIDVEAEITALTGLYIKHIINGRK